MNGCEYRMIHSSRIALVLEITKDDTLLVRASYRAPEEAIDRFILERSLSDHHNHAER